MIDKCVQAMYYLMDTTLVALDDFAHFDGSLLIKGTTVLLPSTWNEVQQSQLEQTLHTSSECVVPSSSV